MKALRRPRLNNPKADHAAYPGAPSTPKMLEIDPQASIPRSTSSATTEPASGHVGQLPASKAALPHALKNIARVAMSASGNILLISFALALAAKLLLNA